MKCRSVAVISPKQDATSSPPPAYSTDSWSEEHQERPAGLKRRRQKGRKRLTVSTQ